MNTESEIISKCLKGERSAQKELYLKYKDQLFAICLRYALDHAEAQDILQDGFIKIFRDMDSYKPIAPFYAWMRQVTVRCALETIRRKKSRTTNDYSIEEVYHLGTSEMVTAKLGADELLKLVQGLPEELRTVFNLYAIDGYSHKEISIMHSISEGNSKVRLSRARTILKQQVERLFEVN